VIRVVSANLVGLDIRLDHAAQSLGAGRFQVFRTITLPLLRPGIVAGAMLAFVQSFDELIVSLFLTGPELSTLPVKICHYIEFNSDPTIAAISVIVVVISTTVVLLAERIVGLSQFL
jgi:putative spermidine/putrescine transport system permease protein